MFKLKNLLLISCSLLFSSIQVKAQISYMSEDGVAVFYPKDYNAKAHLPSPIFLRELTPKSQVPSNWDICPVYSKENGKNIVTISVAESDDLYGTGEVAGPLRRNGQIVKFWNTDNPAYGVDEGKRLYQSHPWVLGVRKDGSAYGIIADNTWRSSLKTDSEIRFESEGPEFRVIIIKKDSPESVLKTLGELTGKMEMPPLWALGYQQCRFSYNPDSRVKEIADTLRYHNIPSDVIWMDIDYMDGYKIFTFNPKEFPDPKGLNDYLHKKNFKSVYMIDPGVKVEKGYFVDDIGTKNNYWVKDKNGNDFQGNVWPGACHFPDFTRPDVRQWWASLYHDFVAKGVDGVWNDMNEPSVFGGPDGSMPVDNIHLGGEGFTKGSHLRYHNIFGYFMVKASREGLLQANPNKRPFILSRSNFLGGQRYAATWTGDNYSSWEHMKMSIPMTVNMGLSGQPFNGPDIGGFCGESNGELVANWTATGVYFPFVRNHSIKGVANQEPWAYGKEVLDVCRTAINRRYIMLPYIYTAFREASKTGVPYMRPAFMADLKDKSLRDEQYVFMIGDDMIVIPRWASSPAIPKGNWKILKLEEKDDKYQAYVAQRPGSIVPIANLYQNTEEYKTDSLTLLVNPDENGGAAGRMYEDAGDGFEYKSGQYTEYSFKASTSKNKITVDIEQVAGEKSGKVKNIRIGYVCHNKIIYSPWVKDNSISMKVVKEKQQGIDVTKLSFRKENNINIK